MVVSIVARKPVEELVSQVYFSTFLSQTRDGLVTIGSGTGFLISSDGMMVTNRHVVDDEQAEYSAMLSDGSSCLFRF